MVAAAVIFLCCRGMMVPASAQVKKEVQLAPPPQPSPKPVGRFLASPARVSAGDTVYLHLPVPHDHLELVLHAPKKRIFILVQPFTAHDSASFNIMSDEAFDSARVLAFATGSFMARQYVHGAQPELVFRYPGRYTFEMAVNLEDDSGVRGDMTSVYFIHQKKRSMRP